MQTQPGLDGSVPARKRREEPRITITTEFIAVLIVKLMASKHINNSFDCLLFHRDPNNISSVCGGTSSFVRELHDLDLKKKQVSMEIMVCKDKRFLNLLFFNVLYFKAIYLVVIS